MALLQEKTTQCHLHLRALHLFGRNRSRADTTIDRPDVSQIHASIRWDGAAWWLHDHSRNGTYVNLHAIGPGASHLLAPGEIIHFASGAKQFWTVLHLAPPCAQLLPANRDQPAIMLEGLHLLPDEHMPEAAIYQNEHGYWLYEGIDGSFRLTDGASLCIGQHRWQYFNGASIEATTGIASSLEARHAGVKFHFAVSQNEEHVELSIATGKGLIHLGERSHHYGLLTLARQRLADAHRGFDSYSQGWLSREQLAQMLRVDPKHLNMQLHRARHQISQAMAANAIAIIEHRRGELRFGHFCFQIQQGSRLEAAFDPAANNGGGQII